MDGPRCTCSGAKFSPYETEEPLSVLKTSIDISQPLQDAFSYVWDAENAQDLDDTEGCPLEEEDGTKDDTDDDTNSVDSCKKDGSYEDDPYPPTYSPSKAINSTTDDSSLTKQDARKRAYRRKKKQKTRERKRSEPGHSLFSPKFKVRVALSQKLSKLAFMRTDSNVANLRAAKGAWVGVRGAVGRGLRSLHSLLEEGYEYKAWDGM